MVGATQLEEEPTPEATTTGATHGTMVDPAAGAAAATMALVACGGRSKFMAASLRVDCWTWVSELKSKMQPWKRNNSTED
ncbi:hypothetical protein E2562_028792 [Oryza meyeriana var. granulata]|uniref:Uncharacterized protein n=1 Tax=Oryza meyeriana var. granulata TaxID=110450 RepID=A0A6G1EBT1_9ORYZ|nr:hypothetical protein E2562_028792 [Oryza meyeriana var. granulata]